jgi:hypothetical protein
MKCGLSASSCAVEAVLPECEVMLVPQNSTPTWALDRLA